jgi:hypothetical protein
VSDFALIINPISHKIGFNFCSLLRQSSLHEAFICHGMRVEWRRCIGVIDHETRIWSALPLPLEHLHHKTLSPRLKRLLQTIWEVAYGISYCFLVDYRRRLLRH